MCLFDPLFQHSYDQFGPPDRGDGTRIGDEVYREVEPYLWIRSYYDFIEWTPFNFYVVVIRSFPDVGKQKKKGGVGPFTDSDFIMKGFADLSLSVVSFVMTHFSRHCVKDGKRTIDQRGLGREEWGHGVIENRLRIYPVDPVGTELETNDGDRNRRYFVGDEPHVVKSFQ